MPTHFAIRKNPDAPPVAFDIGNIKNFGVFGGEVFLSDVNLQVAELATETHERCFVEGLISEEQQCVLRPQLSDCRYVFLRRCPRKLETQYFGAEAGPQ